MLQNSLIGLVLYYFQATVCKPFSLLQSSLLRKKQERLLVALEFLLSHTCELESLMVEKRGNMMMSLQALRCGEKFVEIKLSS